MFVGLLTLRLLIHDANSLKEKRHVVNSILDRTRARWNVSAAQIDTHDRWNDAQIAVAIVSNDRATALKVMNHIRDFAENDVRFDVAKFRANGAKICPIL